MPGTDGRSILKAAQDQIRHASASIDVLTKDERTPIEYRQSVRREQLLAARLAFDTARKELNAWAESAKADATRRLNQRKLGDAAAESRNVARELRISRILDQAKNNGTPRLAVKDLEDRANLAWSRGDTEEAYVLARAASELRPGSRDAEAILRDLEEEEILADPSRASAMRELNDIQVVLAAAGRDLQAAMAETLVTSSRAARDLGEHRAAQADLQAAAEASVRAKTAAWMGSKQFGDGTYTPPQGVLPDLPANVDPRGPSQPDGAHLLSPEERDAVLRAAGVKA